MIFRLFVLPIILTFLFVPFLPPSLASATVSEPLCYHPPDFYGLPKSAKCVGTWRQAGGTDYGYQSTLWCLDTEGRTVFYGVLTQGSGQGGTVNELVHPVQLGRSPCEKRYGGGKIEFPETGRELEGVTGEVEVHWGDVYRIAEMKKQ